MLKNFILFFFVCLLCSILFKYFVDVLVDCAKFINKQITYLNIFSDVCDVILESNVDLSPKHRQKKPHTLEFFPILEHAAGSVLRMCDSPERKSSFSALSRDVSSFVNLFDAFLTF